jgi:hypothetical protein
LADLHFCIAEFNFEFWRIITEDFIENNLTPVVFAVFKFGFGAVDIAGFEVADDGLLKAFWISWVERGESDFVDFTAETNAINIYTMIVKVILADGVGFEFFAAFLIIIF